MKPILAIAMSSALLAGCARAPAPASDVPSAGAGNAPATVAKTPPATTAPVPTPGPAPAPSPAPVDPTPSLAHWDGYGDTRFGMDEAAFKAAWGGDLNGLGESKDPKACHHLNPIGQKSPAQLAFMFDGGHFVRYTTDSDKQVAPGGGHRGMNVAGIEALYPGQVKASPHKYVEGGKYLRIVHDKTVLVFETDAKGSVTEWRLGVPPQVDYIEGCS